MVYRRLPSDDRTTSKKGPVITNSLNESPGTSYRETSKNGIS